MKDRRKVFLTMCVLSALCFSMSIISGCSAGCAEKPSEKHTYITLDKAAYTAKEDEIFNIKAAVDDDKSAIVWFSSDPSVVSVTAVGNVLAKNVGTAVITAKCGDYSADCKVTVVPDGQDGCFIMTDKEEYKLGLKGRPSAKVDARLISVKEDNSAIPDVKFEYATDDPSVAEVSSEGVLTARKEGFAVLNIRAAGDYSAAVGVRVYTACIATPDDWLDMFNKANSFECSYYLGNDIDFNGVDYDTGEFGRNQDVDKTFFASKLDGDFHSVKNIVFKGTEQSVFGVIVGAEIRNISFENLIFTKEAEFACGLAYAISQRTEAFDKKGTIHPTRIDNVILDLAFETDNGCGLSRYNYGCNISNTVVRIKKADTSEVADFPDITTELHAEGGPTPYITVTCRAFMGMSRYAYNWNWGDATVNNLIVIGEIENAVQGYFCSYGEFTGNNKYFCSSLIRGSYIADKILDKTIWQIFPNKMPAFAV